jgi:Fuc2NAc and GlcNAc transferase
MDAIAACLLSAGGAAVLTGIARKSFHRRGMFDVPNQRSSHANPVPRGGGIAIVTAFVIGLLLIFGGQGMDARLLVIVVPGASAVAAVGWLDDRHGASPRLRAAVHFVAAAWAVAWLGGLPELQVGLTHIVLGRVGAVLAVVGVVWFLNLFNFMDGIDGIAGSQAVLIALVAGLIAWLNADRSLAVAWLLLGGSAAGFVVWNWPPARIFMGDVGSGFLGYCLAVLALVGERSGSVPLLAWTILVAVFGFDATITLVRRLIRGERVYEAHRRHAYQRAVISGFTHRTVTIAAATITAALGAGALAAALQPAVLWPVLLGALLMLCAVYAALERRQPMF